MGWLSKLFGGDKAPVDVKSITDENFEQEVLRSELPVLLDVWGPGCAPCTKLAPIVMELSRKYHGRLKVAELNASESPHTAARLYVRGTPTVLYFAQGKEKERMVGFHGQLYHEDYIENELLPELDSPSAPQ